jgi:hypothetical protein
MSILFGLLSLVPVLRFIAVETAGVAQDEDAARLSGTPVLQPLWKDMCILFGDFG